jgi:hypothetical protein
MITNSLNILKIIASIRDSHPDMTELYTKGQCYNFHLILRSIFPNAEPYYDYVEGHMYTKIDRYWYDIRGIHFKINDSCIPYTVNGHPGHRWGKSDRRRLVNLSRELRNLSKDKFSKGQVLTIEWLGKSKVVVDRVVNFRHPNAIPDITVIRLDKSGKKLSGDENNLTLSSTELSNLINK